MILSLLRLPSMPESTSMIADFLNDLGREIS